MNTRTRQESMSYGKQTARYNEAKILGSSREQLVVLLYEHLLVCLRRAAIQIHNRDYEGKAASFEKASDILYELLASLNLEAGGELASRLAALYGWFITEIGDVSRTLDRERLERMIAIVGNLHDAWVQAAAQLQQGGSPDPTIPGQPPFVEAATRAYP